MGSERHSLRKQSFRISAASEDIALALQTRLPDLNRRSLIDIIEKVLDSYSSPARHIRIDRLRVDLGTIVLGRDFDEDVKTRLERELRQALDEAVRDLETQPSPERFARTAEEARLDLLEHYLTTGTLPFWAEAPSFDVEAVVGETAAATPDGLVRLLRRHREETRVIRRLVAQLSDHALIRLLEVIEPDSGGRVSAEIEAARHEDRRFATWVRILTDAIFEHRDATASARHDAAQPERSSLEPGNGPAFKASSGEEQSLLPVDQDLPLEGKSLSVGDQELSVEDQEVSFEEPGLAPDGEAARRRNERADLSYYDRAEAIGYFVRFGVLPWTATLTQGAAGNRPPSVEALLATLPDLPVSALRAIFSVPDGESSPALFRAVERMSADTRARLLAALRAETGSAEVFTDASAMAPVLEQPRLYVRTLLRMLHGGIEHQDETAAESVAETGAPAAGQLPAPLSDVHWIKSILADRAKTGQRSSRPDVSSSVLLHLLVAEHPADAEHFFRVLQIAGIAPATLLVEPVAERLSAHARMLLPVRARSLVALLLRLVSRLPVHEQPGDESGVRTAVTGAVLDHIAAAGRTDDNGTRVSLAARVLRALFGPVMAPATLRQLATGAAQLAHEADADAGNLEDISGALQAVAGGRQVTARVPDRLLDDAEPLGPAVDVHRGGVHPDLTTRDVHETSEAAASPPDGRTNGLEEAQRISTFLTARFGESGVAESGIPTSPALLRTLVERFPREARTFLKATRDAGFQPSALLGGATAADLLDSVIRLLRPLDRRLISLILQAVSRLPAAERPGDDGATRTVLAGAVLDLAGSSGSGEELATAALQRLFGPAVPPAVQRRLAADVERAGRMGQAGPDAVTVLLQVLGPAETAPDAAEPGLGTAEPAPGAADKYDSTRPGAVAGADARSVRIEDVRQPTGTAPAVTRQFTSSDASTELAREASTGVAGDAPTALAGDVSKPARERTSPKPGHGLPLPSGDETAPLPPGGSTGAAESSVSEPAERPSGLPADVVAAALARLRGPARIAAETQASVGQPTATIEEPAATPPRLYQPGRFPIRRPPVAPAHPGEPAAPPESAPAAAARQRAAGAEGARARLSDDALRHVLRELIETSPGAVRAVLVEGLAEHDTRERWVRSFNEPELAGIVWLLEPARHRVLIATAELLFAARNAAVPMRADVSSARKRLWAFLLEVLSRHPEGERSVDAIVAAFFASIGVDLADAGVPEARVPIAEALFARAVSLAERKGHARLRAVLSQRRGELMALATGQSRSPLVDPGERPPTSTTVDLPPSGRAAPRTTPSRQRLAFRMGEDEPESDTAPVHIGNAGLVIVGVFLPQFFALLDVLEENPTGGTRVRPDSVSRAVHLLQYLVDERTNTPEPLLSLNKVLCGMPLAVPVDREIEMTARERELCDSLLEGLLQQWTIIKDSSVAALRETYLQREGRLDHLPTGWRLQVQRKTVDQLMDYMPWPVSTIAHRWMPEPLYVTW